QLAVWLVAVCFAFEGSPRSRAGKFPARRRGAPGRLTAVFLGDEVLCLREQLFAFALRQRCDFVREQIKDCDCALARRRGQLADKSDALVRRPNGVGQFLKLSFVLKPAVCIGWTN